MLPALDVEAAMRAAVVALRAKRDHDAAPSLVARLCD